MTAYDSISFSAGLEAGTRLAACVARLGAAQLLDDSHWWNRRRRRLMARALVACADEMECDADARGAGRALTRPDPVLRFRPERKEAS